MSLRKRLSDPFGLGAQADRAEHYSIPVAPHQHTSRVIYTVEAQRQQRLNAARLADGRTYKPKG